MLTCGYFTPFGSAVTKERDVIYWAYKRPQTEKRREKAVHGGENLR
jgi:hypothetical protein